MPEAGGGPGLQPLRGPGPLRKLAMAGHALLRRFGGGSGTTVDWRAVFEASPDIVFAKDLTGRYIAANPAFCLLIGMPHALLLGMSDEDAADDEVAGLSQMVRRWVTESGIAAELDLEIMHQTERVRRTYSAVLTPIRMDGRITGVAYFGRDVTDRISLEKRLRDAQAVAEDASHASARFLAVASHDLRQPLQGALLFGAALEGRLGDQRSGATLARLRGALDTLRNLIDSLFDMARLDAGGLQASIVDVALNPLFRELEDTWTPAAQAKGLELSFPECGESVRSDPVLLGRILRNLIENAVRYTERGTVRISCSRERGYVRIEVTDTGPGIAPDEIDAIWTESVRLAPGSGDGLGIGLSTVRRISLLLGHEVCVRSAPGQGTSFSLEVPSASGMGDGDEDALAPIPAGLRVILVEDDPLVLLSMRTLLEAWDAQVHTAPDAASAVAAVNAGFVPDLMLADWRLSGGFDGGEAVRMVRLAAGTGPVPAAIITGTSGDAASKAAAATGMGFLRKPISAAALARLIDGMMKGG